MFFSQEIGIAITDEVKEILERAIKIDGNRLQFAKKAGVGFTSVSNWLGSNDRKGEYIVWDAWKKIRPHLEALAVIAEQDIKWMLPSELRELAKNKTSIGLTDDEKTMLSFFRTLNDDGKQAAINSIKGLAVTPALSNSGLNGDKTA